MKPLRLAILSATGTAQKRTIPALVNSKLVTVSAIQGRNPEKLREVSDRYGIQSVHTDEHKLLDEGSYDAVMICSPPYMHFSQAKRVIDRGTHCLLEKPAAMSADECTELSHIAAERAAVVHVAHHLRHQDTYARMQEILNNGGLGYIVTASAEWSFKMNRAAPSAAWKLDPLKNGLSAMNDAGIHTIDAMIGLLGPGSLRAAASVRRPGDKTHETVDILCKQHECLTHIRSSRLYAPLANDLRINGTDGSIYAPGFFTEASSASFDVTRAGKTESVRHSSPNPYQVEVEDFASSVKGLTPLFPFTDLHDAGLAMSLIDAAHQTITST
jgi:D-xylose 1-dehydrogenase (NADP+, D-xylono-1,5-lactone-forming)